MDDDFLLLNPGPVPVADDVLAAMREPMVSHRSAEFESVYADAQAGLDYVFERSTQSGERTADDGTSLILNGTATMAMEAAVANLVDDGDDVVSLVNGKFGRRFARIADRHARCHRLDVTWQDSFDLDAVAATIEEADPAVVTMVHNETSTGVLNPVEAVGALAAEADAHFVVDGVTSIGGDEFRIDDWNVDVAVTDAQKALAIPPGISAMYATDHAIDAFVGEAAPFYEDLDWYVRKADDDQTPFTSAVPQFRALAASTAAIRAEGMPNRIERHHRQAAAFRDAFDAMGLDLFPNLAGPSDYSNTVTAVTLPDALADADDFFDAVAARNVSISGGQAHLGGDIFRVSNMGGLADSQIARGIRTVAEAFAEAGVPVDQDAGLAAAGEHLTVPVEA
jgi:aspartate aminotransferase-like enzyme